jgi:hypothetical protein
MIDILLVIAVFAILGGTIWYLTKTDGRRG